MSDAAFGLAESFIQLLKDHDAYEYNDCYDSDEEAVVQIEEMLAQQAGVNVLIDFCKVVLDSEDDTLYAEAERLRGLLSSRLMELV